MSENKIIFAPYTFLSKKRDAEAYDFFLFIPLTKGGIKFSEEPRQEGTITVIECEYDERMTSTSYKQYRLKRQLFRTDETIEVRVKYGKEAFAFHQTTVFFDDASNDEFLAINERALDCPYVHISRPEVYFEKPENDRIQLNVAIPVASSREILFESFEIDNSGGSWSIDYTYDKGIIPQIEPTRNGPPRNEGIISIGILENKNVESLVWRRNRPRGGSNPKPFIYSGV